VIHREAAPLMRRKSRRAHRGMDELTESYRLFESPPESNATDRQRRA
jgi:hypothetical protein